MLLDNEDPLVHQVFVAKMESLELMVLMVKTVFPEKLDPEVYKVQPDHQVTQFLGLKVLRENVVLPVKKVLKVSLEEMANKVLKEILVLKVQKVKLVSPQGDYQVSLVNRALLEYRENLASLACLDHLVKWVLAVLQENRVTSGLLVNQDKKELPGSLVKQKLDTLVLKETKVLMAFLVNKGRKVLKVSLASKVKLLLGHVVCQELMVYLEKTVNKDHEVSLDQWVLEVRQAKMGEMAKPVLKVKEVIRVKLENLVLLELLDALAKMVFLVKMVPLVPKEKWVLKVNKAKRESVEKRVHLGEWANLIGKECVKCLVLFPDQRARKVFLVKLVQEANPDLMVIADLKALLAQWVFLALLVRVVKSANPGLKVSKALRVHKEFLVKMVQKETKASEEISASLADLAQKDQLVFLDRWVLKEK